MGGAIVSKFSALLKGAPGMVLGAKEWGVVSMAQKIGIFHFLRDRLAMCHCWRIGHWALDRL